MDAKVDPKVEPKRDASTVAKLDAQSLPDLRLDRRLIGRRGWIAPEELESELDALPDVSHKVAPPEPEAGESAASSSEPRPGAGA